VKQLEEMKIWLRDSWALVWLLFKISAWESNINQAILRLLLVMLQRSKSGPRGRIIICMNTSWLYGEW
jgi:hypothetical protein